MKSKYKLGFIGFRIEKWGQAKRFLKSLGGWELNPAQLNNRNGFNYCLPCRTMEDFKKFDFRVKGFNGLKGIAIWFSDAQWGQNSSITDFQWQNRIQIDPEF
jgi:hypothetical protein